jgi:hypothetical protein
MAPLRWINGELCQMRVTRLVSGGLSAPQIALAKWPPSARPALAIED